MFIGTVQCEVELSKSHPAFEGLRFLLVEAEHEVEWTGAVVVVDCAGAELGDMVLVALAPLGERFDLPRDIPIAGAVVGVVGSITTPAEDGGDEEGGEAPAAPERVEPRRLQQGRGRGDGPGPRHGERHDRPYRGERPERGGNEQRPDRGNEQRPDRGERPERGGNEQRPEHGGNDQRPGRGERPERGGNEQRPEHGGNDQRPGRGERPERGGNEQRVDRGNEQRPEQGGNEQRFERGGGEQRGRGEGRFERGERRDRRPRHDGPGQDRPRQQEEVVGPPERLQAPVAPVPPAPVAHESEAFTAVWDEPARPATPAPAAKVAVPAPGPDSGFDIVWDGGGAPAPANSTLKRPRRRR